MNTAARWQDGQPLTVDDVVWSFDTLKDIYPTFTSYYSHVVKAEPAGEHVVRFTFDAPGNRELPSILGQLYVLPKHWWQGKDASRTASQHSRDDAGAAARIWSLQGGSDRSRPTRHPRPRPPTTGAPSCPSPSAPTT